MAKLVFFSSRVILPSSWYVQFVFGFFEWKLAPISNFISIFKQFFVICVEHTYFRQFDGISDFEQQENERKYNLRSDYLLRIKTWWDYKRLTQEILTYGFIWNDCKLYRLCDWQWRVVCLMERLKSVQFCKKK